ncbi:Uncharacterized membrane protein YckC, RDD family [Andreprevotia lacus DSM 23236]|jgi:uncharacterized RDD family membrane protein YckC|uniref:Uncharacterized membrane protein YckC, RDD family n=1 Tax=Andreprevotia lacus DSM 23236 TaxID=1121001 RepID=A0A1W1XV48_9NEIS|nr:RDD family protein [Andreprevotia lacus]SMC27735.1 Uncharacterized membrane protein YckC, RDD family [Andreprevotia lacus DSM 23236]
MTTTQEKSIFVVIDGAQDGPFTLQAIQELLRQGHINQQTPYWQAGMAQWDQLGKLLPNDVPPPLQPPAPPVISPPPLAPAVAAPVAVPAPAAATFINPDAAPAIAPAVPQTLQLAPITSRLLGGLLDGIILAIPFGIGEVVVPLVGGLIIVVLYSALLMASPNQATLGQKVLGLKVVDLQGQRIGNDKAFLRAVMSVPSALLLWFGYFWALFNPKQQTLHDMVAGTCVIRDPARA